MVRIHKDITTPLTPFIYSVLKHVDITCVEIQSIKIFMSGYSRQTELVLMHWIGDEAKCMEVALEDNCFNYMIY